MFNKCAVWTYISFGLPGWWTLTLIILPRAVVALFALSRVGKTGCTWANKLNRASFRAVSEENSPKIAITVPCYVLYIFFSLGSQVSLVSTNQVGDFCVVTLSSLSLSLSLSFARFLRFCSVSLPLSLLLCPLLWHFFVNFPFHQFFNRKITDL